MRPQLRFRSFLYPSLTLLLLAIWTIPVFADDAHQHDQQPKISLSVAISDTVANDVMSVTLTIEERGEDLAELSQTVNQRAQKTAEQVSAVDGVEVENQSYNTYRERIRTESSGNDEPRFIERWVVSQTMKLRYQLSAEQRMAAADNATGQAFDNPFTELTELVGHLQSENVELGSVNFSVSRELQQETRNTLLPDALRALREQASTAARALDARSIRPHDIRVDDRLGGANESYSARMDMAVMAQAAPVAPKFDAGNSEIHMTVSGSFEMLGATEIELR